MDSGGVQIQDLGIDGGGAGYDGDGGIGYDGDGGTGFEENGAGGLDVDMESEEEDNDAAEEAAGVGANLVNEFGINEEQLHNELHCTPVDSNSVQCTPTEHNNQQQGMLQQQAFRPVRQQNNIPPALHQHLMVPQVPQQQQQPIAPYQALLAAGGVARPPFVASCSAGKLTAENYYQQMLLSRMERQEMEEQG
jgi:hypothetical protein